MPLITGVDDFYPHQKDWAVHKQHLEFLFAINNTPAEHRTNLLLSSLRDTEYRKACQLLTAEAETTPTTNTISIQQQPYAVLTERLDSIFLLPKSVHRQRVRFYGAHKEPTQTCERWLDHLKRLAADCQFGNRIEHILTDQFIVGLRYEPALISLFQSDDTTDTFLTLQEAFHRATRCEAAIARRKNTNKN